MLVNDQAQRIGASKSAVSTMFGELGIAIKKRHAKSTVAKDAFMPAAYAHWFTQVRYWFPWQHQSERDRMNAYLTGAALALVLCGCATSPIVGGLSTAR